MPPRRYNRKGFTLIEAIVTISLVAVVLTVFSASFFSLRTARNTMWYRQASAFLQEELESLRAIPYTTITTRTNGRFLGVSIPRGPWQVTPHTNAPSGANTLALLTAQTAQDDETGLVILPGNYRKNFTYRATILADNTSPSGWGMALAFGYHDSENFYRVRLNAGGIAVDEATNGTTSTLWSQSVTHTKDTWYTIEIVATDGAYVIKKNGNTLTTVEDSTISQGDLAIMAINSAKIYADDITVTESATTTWNFDADTAGSLPEDWRRLSYLDLPNGTAGLTVVNYLGINTLKQATVTVQWVEGGNTHSVTGSSIISQ